MNQVLIGLGSNLGQREKNIHDALRLLNDHDHIEVIHVSSLKETLPEGDIQQPKFMNSAAELQTILSPEELLAVCQSIEKTLGRTVKGNYGPRPIDLDILFYDQEIILSPELTVPHPLLHDRLFVLDPLVEIAPNFMHPLFESTISEIYHDKKGY